MRLISTCDVASVPENSEFLIELNVNNYMRLIATVLGSAALDLTISKYTGHTGNHSIKHKDCGKLWANNLVSSTTRCKERLTGEEGGSVN